MLRDSEALGGFASDRYTPGFPGESDQGGSESSSAAKVESSSVKMPKQKTHKGTKKRFRLTANGKAKHRKAGTSHLAVGKTPKRIRQLRGTKTVATNMERVIHLCLRGNSL